MGDVTNTKLQVSELESLLTRLPDASKPLRRVPRETEQPGTARQLDARSATTEPCSTQAYDAAKGRDWNAS